MTLSRRYLFFTVFVGGMTTLAIEFTTSRMLQTVYGTSNLVWANVIGLVLLFLTAGYFLGGRWADRSPHPRTFYLLICAAGFSSIFFLLITSVILKSAAAAMAELNVGAIASSIVGVAFALLVPITLLGCISPFAIRLAVRDVAEAGKISGQMYAISTLGSLVGTYLPTLIVIPLAGSRLSAVIFGSLLLIIGLIGLWQVGQRQTSSAIAAAAAIIIPAMMFWSAGNIKNYEGQIFETESAYNYIQVVRRDDCNYLLLNEGQAFHSFYCDGDRVPRISVWSIMLAAPYFNDPAIVATNPHSPLQKLAVVGLAAGTIPKQYVRVFDEVEVDGIELDPQIVQAGYDYFDLQHPRINVITGDGRYQLNQLDGGYDVITIDAYKVPYIPWHLTTTDFFSEVKAQLTENGVVAVNVGRAPNDRTLVEAMTATMQEVFATVHTADVPGSLNTILFATVQPTSYENAAQNLARLDPTADPLLRQVLELTANAQAPTVAGDVIFTDERAPVETIIDSLVLRYILDAGIGSLPTINQ